MSGLDESIKCQIEGCTNGGGLLDHDGVIRCQEHLVDKIFEKKKIKIKIGRNDPCPCGSGEKLKNCCITNPLKFWFLSRIGTRVFYSDPKCPQPMCESCQKGRIGLIIGNPKHAVELYEYCNEHEIKFTNIDPKKDGQRNGKVEKT